MPTTADSGKQIAQGLGETFRKPIAAVQGAMAAPGEFLMRLLGMEPAQPVQAAPAQNPGALPAAWEKANQESVQQQLAPKPVLRMRRPNQ